MHVKSLSESGATGQPNTEIMQCCQKTVSLSQKNVTILPDTITMCHSTMTQALCASRNDSQKENKIWL
jgi:hypothetical protein